MSHTQGKLSISEVGSGLEAEDEQENVVFQIKAVLDGVLHEKGKSNTRRLVACWNACEGISTEILEESVVKPTLSDHTDAIAAQRDELLAALEGMLDRYVSLANSGDAGNWDCEEEDEVIAARQAIANVKGEA